MRAIILAAGSGQRLRPLTNDRPKCLVPYKGKPILQHLLGTFAQCDISDIVVVGGHRHETLDSFGVRKYINPDYASTNMVHTLFCAEGELQGDVIISYSDIVYGPRVLRSLIESSEAVSVVVDKNWRALWNQRMADPLQDAETLKLDDTGHIRELGRKPQSYEEIAAQYIGLIKFSRAAIEPIRTFYHSLDRSSHYEGKPFQQMYMTTFIQLIIDRLMPVKAVEISGGWTEIDSPDDLAVEVDLS